MSARILKQACWATRSVCALLLAILAGCQSFDASCSRNLVSDGIALRFAQPLACPTTPREMAWPPDVVLEDGLTEQEAISLALWNNATYQEMLTDLGVTNAQLFDAGLIADPQFLIYFPIGPRQLEVYGYQTVDALWLRPVRIRAAQLDVDRVTETMIQNGLDVIRDVRLAHSDLILAIEQARLGREAAALRREIADLSQKRLAAGDISELEANSTQIDALQAEALAQRADQDVELARERLRVLTGLTMSAQLPDPVSASGWFATNRETEDLVGEAFAMRPDMRAVEIAIQAADERVDLTKLQFMTFDAVYTGKAAGGTGFASAPGARFTVPLWNRNRGQIAIAQQRWEQTCRRYVTVRDQIALDVRTAHLQLQQAQMNLEQVRHRILPVLKDTTEVARRNYEDGGAPYFLVLQTTSQYLDARTRELQLEGDVRRAIAQLDRSVGRRISSDPVPELEALRPASVPSATVELLPVPVVQSPTTIKSSPSEPQVDQAFAWARENAAAGVEERLLQSASGVSLQPVMPVTDTAEANRSVNAADLPNSLIGIADWLKQQSTQRFNAPKTSASSHEHSQESVSTRPAPAGFLLLAPAAPPDWLPEAGRAFLGEESAGQDGAFE